MADKLHFSLVSPERELFSGLVDQVDAPGSEGDFGVLAGHAPFMTALKEGQIRVHNEGRVTVFDVRGPQGPSWKKGPRSVRGRGPRDTYG